MSQYESYSVTSLDYDSTRVPIGVDTLLSCLQRGSVELASQTVLEAGCGTGNYLHALRQHVGTLVGIDFSQGMLDQARDKLGDDVELTCGSILEMPFDDQRFDGITCNQVIHHLDEGPTSTDDPQDWQSREFPNVRQFLHEAYRVLRPGGALVLNATTHDQFRDGYWWADLIPTAVARLSCRMPEVEALRAMLVAAGFQIESVQVDLEGVLQGASYLDPTGPLNAAWRAGDSTWSLASVSELAQAEQRVEQMNRDGTMQDYLNERERKRRSLGQ